MQTQMEGRIDFLESQVKKLQAELGELVRISLTQYHANLHTHRQDTVRAGCGD